MKPRQYYQVNKNTFDVLFSEIANVSNFFVLEFQRLLFAEKTVHTAVAFVISFLAYKLVRYIPLWGLALVGAIMAFTLPPLYLRNQEVIDQHITQAQNLAAEKANYARNIAGEKVGVVAERARVVTSDLGKKAGVELPWSPSKVSATTTTTTKPTTTSVKPVGQASGVSALQGLNVPQGSPLSKVDHANVTLTDTPAPVAL